MYDLLGGGDRLDLVSAMLTSFGLLSVVLALAAGYLAVRWFQARRDSEARGLALAALEKNQRARRLTEERFRSLVLSTSDVIVILTIDGLIDFHSPSAVRIWGYSADVLRSASLYLLVHPDDVQIAQNLLAHAMSRPRLNMAAELRLRLADDSWCYFEVVATNLLRDPRVNGVVATFRDISERKDFEQALRYQAFHDSLTDLPNRVLFVDKVEAGLARAIRQESSVAVLFLDLDDFKIVNDSLGHAIGDRLLVALSERLKACLRHEDTLARLSGDEFAILIEDVRDLADPLRLAARIHEYLESPLALDRHEVLASVSIGIVVSEAAHTGPDDLLRDADLAMYHAKANGKCCTEVFDRTMKAQFTERLSLERSLRRAIEHDELRVLYQPIVSLDTGATMGFEALVRWEHPQRGMISPADFIPLAEETGLIVPIGAWVLEEACRQVQEWRAKGGPGLSPMLSVNVSARQFQSPELVETVAAVLDRTGFDPTLLKLELTESSMMHDAQRTIRRLAELRELSIQLVIDDFGTGYSSLAYLRKFPISVLKVDRAFIDRLGKDPGDDAVVRSIVTLAADLGMEVVAEGIETPDQLQILRDLGCDYGQGYYFSRPLPAHQAEQLIVPSGAPAKRSTILPLQRGTVWPPRRDGDERTRRGELARPAQPRRDDAATA